MPIVAGGKDSQTGRTDFRGSGQFALHVFAYLNLAAEPLPGFGGRPGYTFDIEIDPPSRQSRLVVAFRMVLALPALLILVVLAGYGANVYNFFQPRGILAGSTLVSVAALFGWFGAIARARISRGLRDLIAYGLSYGAQVWGYLLLLTDRYPSADPLSATSELPVRSDPVRLEIAAELRRSRLTVFFRLPLAFPHLVWLSLWSALVLPAAIVNWVATLIMGTSPSLLHRFLGAYLRYQLQVSAFLYLVGNPFPGFVGGEGKYPIELRIAEGERQGRWTVLFRLILALPALWLSAIFGWFVFVIAVLGWFAALITGRMPVGLRNAGALALRYIAQTSAYVLLVTGAYPYAGPCLERAPTPKPTAPSPQPTAPTPQPA